MSQYKNAFNDRYLSCRFMTNMLTAWMWSEYSQIHDASCAWYNSLIFVFKFDWHFTDNCVRSKHKMDFFYRVKN